jgi:uncharacterized membrane protein YbhN (UPF0104 family)
MKRTLQRVLPVAVSLAVLVWLLRGMDFAAVAAALRWRVVLVLLPSLVAYGAVTLWLEAQSFARLVHPPAHLPAWTAARIKCASYLLGIVNYTLGAGALAVLLRRRAGLSLAHAASLVLLVSTTDLVVVLSLAGAGTLQVRSGAPTVNAGLVAAGLVGLFGGLALLRMPGSLGPLDRLRGLAAFDALRSVPLADLGRLLALRIIFCCCFVGICAMGFVAFDVWPPLPELVSGVLLVAVVGAIPIAVAGLGTTQAAFVYLFDDYGSRESLLAMSLLLSAGLIALRAAMGVVFAREFTQEALRETRESAA